MILYAPYPPQLAFAFTPDQMRGLDRRLSDLSRLPADPSLLVQDSARLLNAILSLKVGGQVWEARPGSPAGCPAMTEEDWATALVLTDWPVEGVSLTELWTALKWGAGTVAAFHGRLGQVYDLRDELDRVLFECLLQDRLAGVDVVRAHRLGKDGVPVQWRAVNPARLATR